MFLACLLLTVAVASGTLLTVVYDHRSGFAARLAMGVSTGLALWAIAGFLLASLVGLNAVSLAGSAALMFLPLLLLLRQEYRLRAWGEFHSAFQQAFKFVLRPSSADGGYFLFYIGLAILLGLVLGRNLLERADGIYTGLVNNLGDLPLHLQIISSFVQGNNFPVQDPTYAGVGFTYPLLADFLTAMLVRAGAGLSGAMWIQNMALTLALVGLLHCWTAALTRSRLAGAIATALVIFSGGLGWWLIFQDVRNSDHGLIPLLAHLPHDYTIMGESIFRWGNSLTTLLVPQRSILFGLPLALCVFYLWWQAIEAHAGLDSQPRLGVGSLAYPPGTGAATQMQPVPSFATRRLAAAGICTGLLPLVHAHTFAVIVGVAACLMLLFRGLWRSWLFFFLLTSLIAIPEMLWLSLHSGVAARTLVGWHVGWDHADHNILWFWFVNTGLFIPLLVTAIFVMRAEDKAWRVRLLFYAPFALCFIVPNLGKLAPWSWDNIKVLYYWYVASVPLVASLLAGWLAQKPVRRWMAAGFLGMLVLAGALDILRVLTRTTEYEEFSRDGINTAQLISLIATPQAVILHAPTYDSPVFLTGRRSLLGYPGWMWSRGIDYSQRADDIRKMYSGTPDTEALLRRYRVDYVLLGPQERKALFVNEAFWQRYSRLAQIGEYQLYKVERGR
jgi:hypothetical protein